MRDKMQSSTAGMTLEEQIGQLFMVGFWGPTISQNIIDLIRNYHVGGVILFARNTRDAQQVRSLTYELQMIAKNAGHRFPLLISIDRENGMVNRLGQGATQFPGNMTLGAIGSEQMTHDVAKATGRELKALGINMNLAPVVDVNNNSANPVIGVRSFGEDPQQVARLAVAMIKGYHDAGIITTLKHFPGHGDTSVDSHLALPTILHTLERLEAVELVPFKSGIEAGADSVMLAHIVFPALTQDALPATVSSAMIQGLLREKLGFEGVVISDCMEMNAITKTIGVERASVLALQGGVDIVLVSHRYDRQGASIEAVRTAVQANELSPRVVQQAAERVVGLKQRFLSWDEQNDTTVPIWVGGAEHEQLRDAAYEVSTTLVRNDAQLLPLPPDARLLVLSLQNEPLTLVEDERQYPSEFLVESIRHYHTQVETLPISASLPDEQREEIVQAARASDLIIAVTVNAHLDTRQAQLMQALIGTGRRVIGIAAGNPYDPLAFPNLSTYLLTYEYTQPALRAAVRVLFGDITAQGRMPVSI